MSFVNGANAVIICQSCIIDLQFPDALPSFFGYCLSFVVCYLVGVLDDSSLCATVLKAAQDGKFHWSKYSWLLSLLG